LQQILEAHFPEQRRKEVFETAIAQFMAIRQQTQTRSSRKQPSTNKLIDGMKILDCDVAKLLAYGNRF